MNIQAGGVWFLLALGTLAAWAVIADLLNFLGASPKDTKEEQTAWAFACAFVATVLVVAFWAGVIFG